MTLTALLELLFLLTSPSSTSLLPALCSHMGWTPALHVAGLGFNLS